MKRTSTERLANGALRLTTRPVEILDSEAGVSFVSGPGQLDSLECPQSFLLDHPAFVKPLQRFVAAFHDADSVAAYEARTPGMLPRDHVLAYVNVFGKVVRVPVKDGASVAHRFAQAEFQLNRGMTASEGDDPGEGEGEAPECKCLNDQPGCTRQTKSVKFVGSVTFCDAGACMSCEMKTSTK